jgi:hypothetical protein
MGILYMLTKYGNIFSFKNDYPLWITIFLWVYASWGVFNLIHFIYLLINQN